MRGQALPLSLTAFATPLRICKWENPLKSVCCAVAYLWFLWHEQYIAPALMLALALTSIEHYLIRQANKLQVLSRGHGVWVGGVLLMAACF